MFCSNVDINLYSSWLILSLLHETIKRIHVFPFFLLAHNSSVALSSVVSYFLHSPSTLQTLDGSLFNSLTIFCCSCSDIPCFRFNILIGHNCYLVFSPFFSIMRFFAMRTTLLWIVPYTPGLHCHKNSGSSLHSCQDVVNLALYSDIIPFIQCVMLGVSVLIKCVWYRKMALTALVNDPLAIIIYFMVLSAMKLFVLLS